MHPYGAMCFMFDEGLTCCTCAVASPTCYHPKRLRLTQTRPQMDYNMAWLRTVQAYQELASRCAPDVRVSAEFKPTDPSTRFSIVPNTAAACWLAQSVARPNFGLTLDIGHVRRRARCGGAGDFAHKRSASL
jgi:sugar phosphate isomerase/epimerase